MHLFRTSASVLGKLLLILCAALCGFAVPAFAQYNSTIFGPNVYVFDPTVSGAVINSDIASISNANVSSGQFSSSRAAVLFKPGTYSGVSQEVGFYTSIAGLGLTPDSTVLNGGGLYLDVTDSNGNLTTNFWRSMENLRINVPSGDTETWGVSQGASLRRVHIAGGLELTNQSCGEASGGFIADTTVDNGINACSQQQWYTRNSTMASFTDNVWNFVFSGDTFTTTAPSNTFPKNTILSTTPVVREKPFLYIDSGGNYNVFVPTVKTSSSGVDWTANGGLGTGYSDAISTFYIATPSNTAAQINSALSSGKNLILTPGIYKLTAPISITNAKTIVLGLGYPTLIPQSGTSAITVADVDGVQIADLLIDAGPTNSPVLMQIGVAGATRVSHAGNPTSISDVYFRIGGAEAGTATTSLELDSNNVILDNIWAWRADHGTGVGWTTNTASHGLIVDGDNVTALGLAVEHYQQSQVQWNGNNGETIFYQSEDPYDVPSQSSWTYNGANGYPSYEVTSKVCSHSAYGLGIYSFFDVPNVTIFQSNAILAPNVSGINFTNMVTVMLSGSGGISNVINSTGGATTAAGTPHDFTSYAGNGTCSTSASNVDINAGGAAVSPFVADTDFSGGSTYAVSNAISTAGVTNPAPVAVYQDAREGTFTYTVPGFVAGSTHTVRLHFAELYFSATGQREFDVAINGTPVLTNFDIVATAGGQYKANIQQFTATANSSGQIVITYSNGAVNQPEMSGIEIQ
ncbi:malectin domain-containing carbohydrate-binding protein [Granulicella sp. S190]|uniref:malectin domain-containing carbohydrate-binding protein n=1 Tax=Granulicella sp. S190 TaxID=1747226 RepID=UPI00131C9CF3|nr:malectin domain-containing carbohydrate-binding protein [Granulicella sp. S190]